MRQAARRLVAVMAVIIAAMPVLLSAAKDQKDEPSHAISPKLVAQYVYEVIEADRSLYTTHVVERMKDHDIVLAVEAWRARNALPLPAQMLMLAGTRVKERGSGLQFRLASLWPIYEENGPANSFERTGLEKVAEDPSEPYTGVVKRGDRRFFKAIYADRAVSKSCVGCHNSHLQSPRRNYKVGDVMGGVVISFPLE